MSDISTNKNAAGYVNYEDFVKYEVKTIQIDTKVDLTMFKEFAAHCKKQGLQISGKKGVDGVYPVIFEKDEEKINNLMITMTSDLINKNETKFGTLSTSAWKDLISKEKGNFAGIKNEKDKSRNIGSDR